MASKIVKGVWFFSLLGAVSVLMYVYASVPEAVKVSAGETPIEIARAPLFYVTLGAFGIVNALVFVVGSLFSEPFFKTWIYGLISLLNLFAVVTMQFINLLNSYEKYDYSRIGLILYATIALVVSWSAAGPFFYLARKLKRKEAI